MHVHTGSRTHYEDVTAYRSAYLHTRIIFILQTMHQTTKKKKKLNCCTLNNVASVYRKHS